MNITRRNAFTLFELLITIAVITIIVGVGFVSIGAQTEARKLDRGLETLHAMIRIARTQAITNGVPARLIINLDESDPDNYLRRIGVMIQDATSKHWRAVERGELLPEGVYLVPQDSSQGVTFPGSWPASERKSIYKIDSNDADDSAVFNFQYPLKSPVSEASAGSPEWIAIQFAPNGRLDCASWGGGVGAPPANLQLVIATGTREAGKVKLRSPNDILAITFKLTGSTYKSEYTDLDETNDNA